MVKLTESAAVLAGQGVRRNPLSHGEGKAILALGDFAALIVPAVIATVTRAHGQWVTLTNQEAAGLLLLLGLYGFFSVSLDLFSLSKARSWRTLTAVLAGGASIFAGRYAFLTGNGSAGYAAAYQWALIAWIALATWRGAFYIWSRVLPFTRRVLIVGAGVSGSVLAEELHRNVQQGDFQYQLIGFLDDDPNKAGIVNRGFPVLGDSRFGLSGLRDLHVDLLVLAINRVQVGESVFSLLVTAKEQGVRVCSMPSLYETLTEKIVVEHVGDNWGIMFPVEQAPKPFIHEIAGRITDVTVGLLGSLLCLPILIGLGLVRLIRRDRSVLKAIPTLGKGGREFLRFEFDLGDKATRLGVERLPQAWNLVRGEMSLVGPQPERPEFAEVYAETVPFFRARHCVRPGVTGWAQVKYVAPAAEEDVVIKLQHDLYYIKHQSPAFDLRVVLLALRQMVRPA